MDTYLYGHTMNPALTANRSYASVGLGDINIQAQSNLSASAFIYPTSGGAVTFLSDAVSSKDFLSKIHRHNTEQVDMRIDLLNFGFWTASRQFHTFSLNLRVAEGSSLPYDVFRFLKDGSSDGNYYDLSGAGLRVRGYAEAAYGISFPVTDAFRIGGKVKALVGLVYGDARFDRFDVTLSGEKWSVASDGRLLSSNLPVTQSNQAVRPQDILDLDDFDPASTWVPPGTSSPGSSCQHRSRTSVSSAGRWTSPWRRDPGSTPDSRTSLSKGTTTSSSRWTPKWNSSRS